MLTALLGDGKDLLPLKRLIIERTEGTPFFMEEMVQVLFEDGVLQRNGTVKLDTRGENGPNVFLEKGIVDLEIVAVGVGISAGGGTPHKKPSASGRT